MCADKQMMLTCKTQNVRQTWAIKQGRLLATQRGNVCLMWSGPEMGNTSTHSNKRLLVRSRYSWSQSWSCAHADVKRSICNVNVILRKEANICRTSKNQNISDLIGEVELKTRCSKSHNAKRTFRDWMKTIKVQHQKLLRTLYMAPLGNILVGSHLYKYVEVTPNDHRPCPNQTIVQFSVQFGTISLWKLFLCFSPWISKCLWANMIFCFRFHIYSMEMFVLKNKAQHLTRVELTVPKKTLKQHRTSVNVKSWTTSPFMDRWTLKRSMLKDTHGSLLLDWTCLMCQFPSRTSAGLLLLSSVVASKSYSINAFAF